MLTFVIQWASLLLTDDPRDIDYLLGNVEKLSASEVLQVTASTMCRKPGF